MFIFLKPYLQLCHLAAWGIAQNLEGLGLFTVLNAEPIVVGKQAFFPLVLSANRGVVVISMLMTFYLALLVMTTIRSSFYLGSKFGFFILLVWLFPGLASCFGFQIDLAQFGPDIFRFNSGFTGGVGPAAANLFFFLTAGWSIVMMVGVHWDRNIFKNIYDHIWYALGLLATLYFVVDTSLSYYNSDLKDARANAESILRVYSASAKQLQEQCSTNVGVQTLAPQLCSEITVIKYELDNELDTDNEVRWKIHYGEWQHRLKINPSIQKEIANLDSSKCKINKSNDLHCFKYPSGISMEIDALTTGHIFPPNEYNDRLYEYRKKIVQLENEILSIERGHNFRYFSFLLVAFLAGGKLANASRALLTKDIIKPRSWIAAIALFSIETIKKIYGLLEIIIRSLFRLIQNLRK